MMTRDDLIREAQNRRGTLPALVLVYMALVGTLVATAYAIV